MHTFNKKHFLLLVFPLLLLGPSAFAQNKKYLAMAAKIKDQFWGNQDAAQNETQIPDKWKGESAVTIFQEYDYEYNWKKNQIIYLASTRQRIMLLDKASVEEYSEFSFTDHFRSRRGFSRKKGNVFAGVKVIKADGTEKEMDLSEAIVVESNGAGSYKKIPIANLEEGDIIDFYYHLNEPFYSGKSYEFQPLISSLSDSYPIMEQRMKFEVTKRFFINFKSTNGAPELTLTDNSQRNTVIYTLIDRDREKQKDLRWFYPSREEPTIKFQVVLGEIKGFTGEKESVKKSISPEDIMAYYSPLLSRKWRVSELVSYLNDKNFQTDQERVKAAFYYIRHYHWVDKLEPAFCADEGINYSLEYGAYRTFYNEDYQFVSYMASYLSNEKIPFDILAAVPRNLSELDNVLMKDEVSLLIRVNLNEPIYLHRFFSNTVFGDIPYHLEGAEAYVMELDSKNKLNFKGRATIPVSHHEDNRTISRIEASFGEDLKSLQVNRQNILKGHNRETYQEDLVTIFDFCYDEYRKYRTLSYVNRMYRLKEKEKFKVIDKIKALEEKTQEAQKEKFEAVAGSDMDLEITSYEGYELLSPGRTEDQPSLVYNDTFQIESLTQKAGSNYILEIGKLIGGQVGLEEEEMERTHHVYMPYPRSFEYQVTFNLPEAYSVEGAENLNVELRNEAGGFVSSATVEGNQLIINTEKYYLHNFEKAEAWPQMIAFLEAAYDFTQEKVLLRKK